jgi:4'-phosphopantetheinyl transferase
VAIELIYFQNEVSKPKVAIARITEELGNDASLFSKAEIDHSLSIKSRQYRQQWLATRALLKKIEPSFSEVIYDTNGKPFLKGLKDELSISHTSDFVAVCIDKQPTGIDIEIIGPRVSRISSRFLSDNEKQFAVGNIMQHIIWGAKECIFKAWSKGNVDFSKDILIEPFILQEEGLITAAFRGTPYNLRYKKVDQLMVVYIENS